MAECVLDRQRVSDIHDTARLIKHKGIQGYQAAAATLGHDMAIGLLMMYLRMSLEAAVTYETPSDLDEQIDRMLRDERILK